jgi:hypothetical protein
MKSMKISLHMLLAMAIALTVVAALYVPVHIDRDGGFMKTYSHVSREYVEEPLLNNICNFIASLYVELTPSYGCVRESPVVENSTCYTSTNLLAEYVLRNLCNNKVLADKVRAFLNTYPADFYDYYQILFSKQFSLPFTTVEHVNVATINGITIKHVKRTDKVMYDYDQYANLVALKALYHVMHGQSENAVAELSKLNSLFDGRGFKDKAYQASQIYETYKLALAVIAYKSLGKTSEAEGYSKVLYSIKPFTTLYTANYTGVGDLNLETACLTAIALYS